MSQDSSAAAMVALTARKEEAREALQMTIAEMGTNPAQVEAERAAHEQVEHERDRRYGLLIKLSSDEQKRDALVVAADNGDNALIAQLIAKASDRTPLGRTRWRRTT